MLAGGTLNRILTIYAMALSKRKEFSATEVRLADLARAISHPARIAILRTLAERQTCICGEIVEVLPLAQSTVSQHLKELKAVGLVCGEVDGPRSCYCLNGPVVKELFALLDGLSGALDANNLEECC